jgi:EAL domain-containing protein (putative c-di-GMP-specific phosphodiesterase class I)
VDKYHFFVRRSARHAVVWRQRRAKRTEIMRTQIIPEHALGLPWLEHFSAKGGPPEKTILDKSPFIIGRGESADLQVVSQGVSREHAAVECEGRAIRIRDLGSTNGTFINGQRIKEADLHDGDMVQMADVEFAFHYGKLQARQAAATQILALDADDDADCSDPASDLRRTVRGLHETLASGCVRGRLKPIVDLRQGQLVGYEAADEDVPPVGPESNSLLPAISGRVVARLRHLRRMRGLERAMAMPGEFLVFVGVRSAEVAAGRLVELARSFCECLSAANRLVVAVPYAAAKEAAQAMAPGGRLRELGVAVALSDMGVGDAGVALLAEIRPDFVRLSASLLRGVPGNSKNLAALQATVQAVGKGGTRVIAAAVNNPSQRAACLEAGCELGQGLLFEEGKRGEVPSRKANPRGMPVAQDAFYLSLALDTSELAQRNPFPAESGNL